jgi:hypothetical protein
MPRGSRVVRSWQCQDVCEVVVGCELTMDQPGYGHHEVFGDGWRASTGPGRDGWGGHVDVCSLHELVANWESGEMVDCRMMYIEVGEGLYQVDVCLLSVRGVGLLFEIRESRPT